MTAAMLETFAEFPQETEGVGNQVLEPTEVLADGTKVFDLTVQIGDWEVSAGDVVEAWTYNGMVPAPMLQLDVGDSVQFRVHNELPIATDVHWHGINVDQRQFDGVAPITQPLIEPGETFTYEFTTDEQAVAMYHPHVHGHMLLPNGMFGPILVGQVRLPVGETIGWEEIPADLEISQEIPMVLNDAGVIGYSLNGKSFPATAAVRRRRRGLGAHPLLQRGQPDPPDAPAPVRPDRRGQGRLPAGRAVHGRHAQRGAGGAVLGAGQPGRAGHLGLALPHPPPRRASRTGMFGMVTAFVVS